MSCTFEYIVEACASVGRDSCLISSPCWVMDPSIEKCEALLCLELLLMLVLLLQDFLIPKSLSIFLELSGERVLGPSWVVHESVQGLGRRATRSMMGSLDSHLLARSVILIIAYRQGVCS